MAGAKSKKSVGGNTKVSFGKRKNGKAKKSHNKHDHTEKNYRGQGR